MSATIKLEFTIGDDISYAFSEAIRISKTLNVCTEFDFNGVTCIATPNSIHEAIGVASYHKAIHTKYKQAFA